MSQSTLPLSTLVRLAIDDAGLEAPADVLQAVSKDIADALVTADFIGDCELVVRNVFSGQAVAAPNLTRPGALQALSSALWQRCCDERNGCPIAPGLRALLSEETCGTFSPVGCTTFNSSLTIAFGRPDKAAIILGATQCVDLHVTFRPTDGGRVDVSLADDGIISLSVANGSFSLRCRKLFVAPRQDDE